ncbi:putative rab effector Noc2 [Triplophysa rosa]|uniref:Rab effector Noc2 n=1 Tax=Triplophysa rosa TaxID=992332 RepID=A0A9W7X4P1_TRIRA|nr:putative rab effector Noc2 [Triplophysa rosa]
MTETMFGNENEQWVCPNDRQLALRAKLHTGWSIHTFQTERQRKAQTLEKTELDIIMGVIHRAEQLELIEQHRIGRLVERLENMRRSAVGNGLSQCLLCGEMLGFLGSSSVLCLDCCMKVCTKCGIETIGTQKRSQWLCKICSEHREVWKQSGAWFYKGLPKHIHPIKDSVLVKRKPVMERAAMAVVRNAPMTYTWAQSKVYLSESDGSDDELTECSSERKTFMSVSDQRRDSESSGGLVQTPLLSSIACPSRTSIFTERPYSSFSERSSITQPTLEDEVTGHGRLLLTMAGMHHPLPRPSYPFRVHKYTAERATNKTTQCLISGDGPRVLGEEVTGVDPVSRILPHRERGSAALTCHEQRSFDDCKRLNLNAH